MILLVNIPAIAYVNHKYPLVGIINAVYHPHRAYPQTISVRDAMEVFDLLALRPRVCRKRINAIDDSLPHWRVKTSYLFLNFCISNDSVHRDYVFSRVSFSICRFISSQGTHSTVGSSMVSLMSVAS